MVGAPDCAPVWGLSKAAFVWDRWSASPARDFPQTDRRRRGLWISSHLRLLEGNSALERNIGRAIMLPLRRKIVLNCRYLLGVIVMNGIVIEELIWSLGPQLVHWLAVPLPSRRGASRPSVIGALHPKGRAKVAA